MNFEHVFDADGAPAVADDMSPAARAFAFLLEHAHRQKDAKLPPCECGGCETVRARIRVELTDCPGEMIITLAPLVP